MPLTEKATLPCAGHCLGSALDATQVVYFFISRLNGLCTLGLGWPHLSPGIGEGTQHGDEPREFLEPPQGRCQSRRGLHPSTGRWGAKGTGVTLPLPAASRGVVSPLFF